MASEAETPAADAAAIAADTSKPAQPDGGMVRLFNPKSRQYGQVPAAKVEDAKRLGWEPAYEPWQAAVAGVGQGASLEFGDELVGAAHGAGALLSGKGLAGAGEAYTQGRDEYRNQLAAAQDQNPGSYLAGKVGGSVLPALAAPGTVGAQAALGAAQGLGETPELNDPGQALKDVAGGATAGAAGSALLGGAGKAIAATKPELENMAGKALLRSANMTPDALRVSGTEKAVDMAKQALREPGLVPPLLAREGATPAVIARNAGQTTEAAGKALGDKYAAFDEAHGPTVSARELALRIKTAAAPAIRDKPALSSHVAAAVRLINPAKWEQIVSQAKAEGPEAVRKLQEIVHQAPHKLIDPAQKLTLTQTQDLINRLRKLGADAGLENPALAKSKLGPSQSVYAPAWRAGADAIKDTAGRVGGPESRAEIEAARSRFGLNTKVKEAAEAADKSGASVPSLIPDGMKMAAGAAAGAASSGTPGAVAGAVAAPVIAHAVAPRMARGLDNLSQMGGQPRPAMHQFMGTFGRLFAGQPVERKVMIDHKLQELSPRYREHRRKANEEAALNPPDEKKPID